jgi:large subunit ribosomal protein L25
LKQQLDVEGSVRSERGKNESRRLRVAGRVPAVLYGKGQDAVAITLDRKEMTRLLGSRAGHNRILNLKLAGGENTAGMAVDWQVDPLRGDLLHVDVKRVDLKQKIIVTVPVQTVGVAIGVKEQGGFEEVVTREVELECLPLEVPEKIELDITNLEINQAIRASDLVANENWTVRTNPARVLVHIVVKKAEVEAVPEVVAVVGAEPGAEAPAAEGGKPAEGKAKEGKPKEGKKEGKPKEGKS